MDRTLMAYDIYCGVDVGKRSHSLVALRSSSQKRILTKTIHQDEAEIRNILKDLSALGSMLVTVDQTGNIGKLLIAVAQSMDLDIAFLTPHDFHQFSEGYSEVKTDAWDAFVIADLSMRMTPLLHPVEREDDAIAGLRTIITRRLEVIRAITALKNQIHDILAQIHPALERVFDNDALDNAMALELLERYGGPGGFRRSGRSRMIRHAQKVPFYGTRATAFVDDVFEALHGQGVTVIGTSAAEQVIRGQVGQLKALKSELKHLEKMIAKCAASIPQCDLLRSMPGIGPVFAPIIITEIKDIKRFDGAYQLAAYSGVAPSKRQSGTTMNSTKKKRRCNRKLKNAFVQSADIARQHDDASIDYYAKKRSEGKSHTQAIIALARHRVDIIYAILNTGLPYKPRVAELH
jgi:transposase